MLMPEATMNKDNRVVFGKDDIGAARKSFAVNSKAEPHSM